MRKVESDTTPKYYGYIYVIKDHLNNKIYIGKRKGHIEKSRNYFGGGKIIKKIIKKRKYHLEKIILGVCTSKFKLNECEKYCIAFFNSNNKLYGYNLSSGGDGGAAGIKRKFSDEHRKKLSEAKLKNPVRFWKNKKFSKTHIQNMKKFYTYKTPYNKGKKINEIFTEEKVAELKEKYSYWKGKKLSILHKQNIKQGFTKL